MGFPEYDHLDGLGIAELIRKGDISPIEVLDAAIERIEARNPEVNAVVYKAYDEARRTVKNGLNDGPFAGVPFLLKDMSVRWNGHPMTCGSMFLRDYRPRYDSHLTQRFKEAGFVLLGTTNAPELGIKGVTEPQSHGATRNPWNLRHTPGGSSGGSAAAVASRMVPLAHGGDGGGSIRIPSSACGLFGFKPTRGRISFAPDAGHSWSGFVCQHVLTRSVRDSAATLDITGGYVAGDPYYTPPPKQPFLKALGKRRKKLRIACWEEPLFGNVTHPDCKVGLRKTVDLLTDMGHKVEAGCPSFERDQLIAAYFTIVAAHVAADVDWLESLMGREPGEHELESTTWFLAAIGRQQTAAELINAESVVHRAGRHVAKFFEHFDVFVTPTTARPPARIGELALQWWEHLGARLLKRVPIKQVMDAALTMASKASLNATPNTQLFNQTGQPAMSMPLHCSPEGLPLGIQFAGRFGEDEVLFRLAAEIEKAHPWAQQMPDWIQPA